MADPRYKAAARIISDLRPNHNENNSNKPPANEPNKFDPRALPRKPARAKLDTKIIPANKTGTQSARVATVARTHHDSKNSFSKGSANITASERNKPA